MRVIDFRTVTKRTSVSRQASDFDGGLWSPRMKTRLIRLCMKSQEAMPSEKIRSSSIPPGEPALPKALTARVSVRRANFSVRSQIRPVRPATEAVIFCGDMSAVKLSVKRHGPNAFPVLRPFRGSSAGACRIPPHAAPPRAPASRRFLPHADTVPQCIFWKHDLPTARSPVPRRRVFLFARTCFPQQGSEGERRILQTGALPKFFHVLQEASFPATLRKTGKQFIFLCYK